MPDTLNDNAVTNVRKEGEAPDVRSTDAEDAKASKSPATAEPSPTDTVAVKAAAATAQAQVPKARAAGPPVKVPAAEQRPKARTPRPATDASASDVATPARKANAGNAPKAKSAPESAPQAAPDSDSSVSQEPGSVAVPATSKQRASPPAAPKAKRGAALRAPAPAVEAPPATAEPTPATPPPPQQEGPPRREVGVKVSKTVLRGFLICVVLPTLITVLYYIFFAAPIYVTEARFWIRGQQTSATAVGASSLSSFLSDTGIQTSQDESLSVRDYIGSRDALDALLQEHDLRAMYMRPAIDFWARLSDDASEEDLLDYYNNMVIVDYDTASGIVTLTVKAFDRTDTVVIADSLLRLSEALVNQFNVRAQQDLLALARSEVERSEERLAANREALTQFRNESDQIDPAQKSAAILTLISSIEAEIAKSEAEIAELESFMRPDNFRIAGLEARIKALRAQVVTEQQRLTGTAGSLANDISEYELLLLERELANRTYESALTSLESARTDAVRQHNYLVRVVSPHLPDEATLPKSFENSITVFIASLFLFVLGRLVVEGVRDHILQ